MHTPYCTTEKANIWRWPETSQSSSARKHTIAECRKKNKKTPKKLLAFDGQKCIIKIQLRKNLTSKRARAERRRHGRRHDKRTIQDCAEDDRRNHQVERKQRRSNRKNRSLEQIAKTSINKQVRRRLPPPYTKHIISCAWSKGKSKR